MNPRVAAVVGGGIGGLSTALLLARRGVDVELYERDPPPPTGLDDLEDWHRPGAPQSDHPHVVLGLLRRLLRDELPDVHADLLGHGVEELPFTGPAGPVEQLDKDLVMMAARRTTVEWALHRAVVRDPRVRVRSGTTVSRIEVSEGRVTGLRVGGRTEQHRVVVDATGSRSRLGREFLRTLQDEECGTVYNTRSSRLNDGVPRPPMRYGSVTLVDGLGYGAALFLHDHGIFSIDIGRLPEDDALVDLREPACFERVVGLFDAFRPWLAPGRSRVVRPVAPMAGLRNVLRTLAAGAPAGYLPVGDRICVTDPTFGRGMTLALAQARQLADAVASSDATAPGFNVRATDAALDVVRPWFDDVVVQDRARTTLRRAAVRGERWQDLLGEMPPNPFMAIDAESHDPELALLARRYISMLAPTFGSPDLATRIRSATAAAASRHVGSAVPSYNEIVAAVRSPRPVVE